MISKQVKGYAYGAVSAASYGVNPLFALLLYAGGQTVDSVLFYRYFFALLMLAVLMKVQGTGFAIQRQEVLPLAVMGLLFSSSSIFLFDSYNYMDAGIASTILFVYPLMVALLMALFFHERLTWLTLGSISLAFVGISLLYKGGNGETLSLFGVGCVLMSSLTYALYIIGVNRSSLKEMPTARLTFYALLFGSIILLVRLRFGLDLPAVAAPIHWVYILLLALFPTIISLITMTLSVHYIGSTPTAILGALEPVTALFFGVMVFNEQLTPRILLGILLILAGVTVIIVADNEKNKRK